MKALMTTIGIAGALGLALVATNAHACRGGGGGFGKGHGARHGGMLRKLIKVADLRPEQKEQLKALRKSVMGDMEGQRRGPDPEIFEGIIAAVESGDTEGLDALHQRKAAKMRQIHQRKARMMKGFIEILDDEQRARVAKKMRKFAAKHQKRREAREQRGERGERRGKHGDHE